MQFLRSIDLKIFYWLFSFSGYSRLSNFFIVFFASYLAWLIPIIFLILIFWELVSKQEEISDILITVFSAGISLTIAKIIQFFYHRPRPYVARGLHSLFTDPSFSFPSAHSSFFFAFAFAIYFFNRKWGIYFLMITTLLTIGRVIAGVHYPSDIFGGLLLGAFVSYITFKIFKKPIEKLSRKIS